MKRLFSIFSLLILLCSISTITASHTSPKVYITGNATLPGWTNQAPVEMTQSSPGVFTWTGDLIGDIYDQTYKNNEKLFKFLTELGNWGACYNSSTFNNIIDLSVTKDYPIVYNQYAGANDFKYRVLKSDRYTITLDRNKMTMNVKEAKNPNDTKHVICIGNSITAGTDIGNLAHRYPGQLQTALGSNYKVYNMGINGATMLTGNNDSYRSNSNQFYNRIKAFNPDIIIIKLGSNDSKPEYWNKDKYRQDYQSMIDDLKKSAPNATFYIGTSCYIYPSPSSTLHSIAGNTIREQVVPIQKEIAKGRGFEVLDFYDLTFEKQNELYRSDKVHPNEHGAYLMAEYAARVISKRPSIIVSSPYRKYMIAAAPGVNNTGKIKIIGRYLTGNINVSVSGDGYSVKTISIPKSMLDADGSYMLEVNVIPKQGQFDHFGKITLSSQDAGENQYVDFTAQARELRLVGDATPVGWNFNSTLKMIPSNDQLVWRGNLQSGSFKFLTQTGTWAQFFYNALAPNTAIDPSGNTKYGMGLYNDSSKDYKFVISSAGEYTVTVDMKTRTVSAKKELAKSILSSDSELRSLVLNEPNEELIQVFSENQEVKVTHSLGQSTVAAELISMSGQVLANVKTDATSFTLGNNLTNGIYVVKITTDNSVISKKVLVK